MIPLEEDVRRIPVLKLIGIGSIGNRAIDYMIQQELKGVAFITVNTDVLEYQRSAAELRILLESSDFFGEETTTTVRESTLNAHDQINNALCGVDMLLVLVEMESGLEKSAALMIANMASALGIITMAVAITPIQYRLTASKAAVADLEQHVDSFIVLEDDQQSEINSLLLNLVAGISEPLTCSTMINFDMDEVRFMFSQSGQIHMGTAKYSGMNRAQQAVASIFASPLLAEVDISSVKGIWVSIKAARSIRMGELNVVVSSIRNRIPTSELTFSLIWDETNGDDLQVTVFFTTKIGPGY